MYEVLLRIHKPSLANLVLPVAAILRLNSEALPADILMFLHYKTCLTYDRRWRAL